MINKSFLLPFSLIVSGHAVATDLNELSLEELMEVKVKVASESEKSLREAPGIITVIDEKQIKALGARDLTDVLISVPGITYGHDVQGNVSVIMRGIWGVEGRILLLIDGHEMNERAYGTFQLSHHYPAENIERIEIIRGPGSAIYGGVAELSVINVITKSGEDLKGLEAASFYSRTSSAFGNSTSTFSIGQKVDDLTLSVSGTYIDGRWSDRNYTDENGATTNMGGANSSISNEHLNFKAEYKNFYFGMIKDNYRTRNAILFGDLENVPGSGKIRKSVPADFDLTTYQLGYRGDVNEKLSLHGYLQSKSQNPYYQWDSTRDDEYGYSYRRTFERKVGGVRAHYQFDPKNSFRFGAEASYDKGIITNNLLPDGSEDTFGNDKRQYKIDNYAYFAQYELNSDIANLTAGLRYDDPSITPSTMVPRLGLTKVFGKSHVKALYAKAFRAPLIENISLNPDIKPEMTTTMELEFGHSFNKAFGFTANVFSTDVDNPIVYSYDLADDVESYENFGEVKTIGLESEFRYVTQRHDMKFNFSTYRADRVDAQPYESQVDKHSLIGAGRYKYYLSDTVTFGENFTFTPSIIYITDVHSASYENGSFKERRQEDQLIVNVFARKGDVFMKGLGLGASINNLLNRNVYFPQPYMKEDDMKASPYPGKSREYVFKIDFKKEF